MEDVIPDTTPADLLSRFRGPITCSEPIYPESLLLHLTDADGEEWSLSTFDADYSPNDPGAFLGKTVTGAEVEPSNTLTIGFSDDTTLSVVPRALEPGEAADLENWFLLTPDGLALDFGPEGRWLVGSAREPW